MNDLNLEQRLPLGEGCCLYKAALSVDAQKNLVGHVRACLKEAPLFTPVMPRTGKPFSVRMSNSGPLGWVSDVSGYRYQDHHPVTGKPWPAMPPMLAKLWFALTHCAEAAEACLINWYDPKAKMGLHQDRDEDTFDWPILSVSLGDRAVFALGGPSRKDPVRRFDLESGDVLVMGGPSRKAYHGVVGIKSGTNQLLDTPGRINLTLRKVRPVMIV